MGRLDLLAVGAHHRKTLANTETAVIETVGTNTGVAEQHQICDIRCVCRIEANGRKTYFIGVIGWIPKALEAALLAIDIAVTAVEGNIKIEQGA